ncbi:hypothetical protein OROMI_031278 [Orobanche minor]
MAVRKGKSVVQHRDGMKQVIEELNAGVERLKSEGKHSEQAILEYEEQPVPNRLRTCSLRKKEFKLWNLRTVSSGVRKLFGGERGQLNEVQERNDGLQEELAKTVRELSEVSTEKDIAENARNEALAHIEKLSYIHSDENDQQLAEIMVLRSSVENMREDLSVIERELGDILSKDLEVLHNMKAVMKSFSELGGTPDFNVQFHYSFPGGFMSRKSEKKGIR